MHHCLGAHGHHSATQGRWLDKEHDSDARGRTDSQPDASPMIQQSFRCWALAYQPIQLPILENHSSRLCFELLVRLSGSVACAPVNTAPGQSPPQSGAQLLRPSIFDMTLLQMQLDPSKLNYLSSQVRQANRAHFARSLGQTKMASDGPKWLRATVRTAPTCWTYVHSMLNDFVKAEYADCRYAAVD